MNLENLRYDYTQGELNESDVSPDPLEQFGVWLEAALAANLTEPYGMTISTVGENGRPSSRVVLLRGFSPEGFVFFTNYRSRKGRDLEAHPYAALNFWWPQLERQIRIEGKVGKVSAEESDAYFAGRPYKSQVASASSPQSEPIPSRQALVEWMEQTQSQHPERVPRPPHWGGYRLEPDYFEFWQGRRSRAHDRLAYTLQPDGSWKITRLAP